MNVGTLTFASFYTYADGEVADEGSGHHRADQHPSELRDHEVVDVVAEVVVDCDDAGYVVRGLACALGAAVQGQGWAVALRGGTPFRTC
jgi:hypothetical protein